jgi:creatinine amidohydrolase
LAQVTDLVSAPASVLRLGDTAAGDPRLQNAILAIPLGATEQHGPHLPLSTDAILAQEILDRAAVAVSPAVPVVVAPCVPYGYSPHHVRHGETMSAGHTALLQLLIDICSSARQSGMRRLFLLNGHAGNTDILGQLARHLSTLCDTPVGHGSYWSIAAADIRHAIPVPIARVPGHAGEFETSLMLALRPELVGATSELAGESDPAPAFVDGLTIEQVARRVGAGGYTDRPSRASRVTGEALISAIIPAVARALRSYWTAAENP